MSYAKQTWHDSPTHDTPLSAARLGVMEQGIFDAHAAAAAVRSPLVTVAASNTPAAQAARADYVCDGTADEAQINTALAALSNGGTVVLLPGDYMISSPILVTKHATHLIGSGAGFYPGASQNAENPMIGTRIQVAAGFAGTAAVRFQSSANVSPLGSCTLANLTIDGNNVGSGVDGVHFRAHTSRMRDVTIHAMTGNGVKAEGYAAPTGWDCYDTSYVGLVVSYCTGAGIYFASNSPDQHVVACVFYQNGYGLRIGSASEQVTNCHFYSNTVNILFDNSGSRTKIVNCKIEQSAQHGIWFDNTTSGTSDVMIVGCNLKNSGASATNTYDHIYFSNASSQAHTRTSIIGCNFSVASATNLPRYCINLPSSAVQGPVNIVGCSFAGNTSVGTAALNIANSATVNMSGNGFASSATGRGEQRGIASVADGGTITIALARTPTWYSVAATVAGHIATVTAVSATSMTISLKNHDGTAVAAAENVTFHAVV